MLHACKIDRPLGKIYNIIVNFLNALRRKSSQSVADSQKSATLSSERNENRMPNDWKSNADAPEMEGRQYHIQCAQGDVAKYVLLPGDPGRTDFIAKSWDSSHLVASNREHRTFTGLSGGVPISVTSTGMGAPSSSIAVEELLRIGADTFIRLGTCGAIQENIDCGDLIINTASVRHDGASNLYVEESYPASADLEVTLALIQACEDLNLKYHVGVGCSTGSFHCGQGRPGFRGYSQTFFENIVEDMRRANVLNFEMEAAALFTMGNIYGFRSGCICVAVANRITNEMRSESFDSVLDACNRAVKILAARDEKKKAAGKKFWTPNLG